MQEVIAAITTLPWRSAKRSPPRFTVTRPPFAASSAAGMPSFTADSGVERFVGGRLAEDRREILPPALLHGLQRDAVLGRRGPASEGSMLPRSSFRSSL